MRSIIVLLFLALAVSVQLCEAESLDTIRLAADAAKAKASQFYLDRAAIDAVVTGAPQTEDARKAAEIANSVEFKQKVEKEKARVGEEVFGIPVGQASTYYTDLNAEKLQRLRSDERIYLFVSSSMPEATLRAYVEDIDRLHDPNILIVLRGFIGGMREFGPSQKFINNLLKKDRSCEGSDCAMHEVAFEIDPNLYRRFKPTQVPALVYARGVTLAGEGVSEGFDADLSNTPKNPWWMIYGDASLSYLLSRVSDDSGAAVLAGYSEVLR